MLKLNNLSKDYYIDKRPIRVLKNLNVTFREKEFVSILGESGSGKTTLLNIIGGLDRYSDGDLLIDDVSTKNYNESDWDSYRNHRIGFVFQSYNLISHLNVISNVELALTISGVSDKERKERAIKILKRVGLKDHIYKNPNQLSGGQMQRVAIARALINEPNIILADEPTGALDSETSVEIMELLKEISHDKLIIMVTHNRNLASEYSDRIVSLKDGVIINDTNPVKDSYKNAITEKTKKTSMSFFTALRLSFKNLLTKKARTILTAFAGSIGIIGIALSLSLKNGFDVYLDKMESENFDLIPIEVSERTIDITGLMEQGNQEKIENAVGGYDPNSRMIFNNISDDFISYLESNVRTSVEDIKYEYDISSRFANKTSKDFIYTTKSNPNATRLSVGDYINQSAIPESFIKEKLNILKTKESNNKYQAFLFVNINGRVSNDILEFLGFEKNSVVTYDEIVGKTFKVYKKDDFDDKTKEEILSKYDEQIEVEITRILSSPSQFMQVRAGIYFNNETLDYIRLEDKSELSLSKPTKVYIYPKNQENKKEIKRLINIYNENETDPQNHITYTDSVEMSISLVNTLTNSVSIILVAFSAISLFVSSVMIGIITYTSVLERTKEIGVLRSIGARKKDISRVFNAEGIMLGFTAGLLGIILTLLLNPIISKILEPLVEYKGIARLNILHGLALIVISIILTLIAGLIPSKIAANKDPVVALRTE